MQGWFPGVKGWGHIAPLKIRLIGALLQRSQHINQVAFAACAHSPAAGKERRDSCRPGWTHVLGAGSRDVESCQGAEVLAYPVRRLIGVLSSSISKCRCCERFGLIMSGAAASSVLPWLLLRLQLIKTAVKAGKSMALTQQASKWQSSSDSGTDSACPMQAQLRQTWLAPVQVAPAWPASYLPDCSCALKSCRQAASKLRESMLAIASTPVADMTVQYL